ncbi:ATP-grasp domain-containing protein [Epidermidibacterium keratini]|uniref:Biotin-dependent 3-methylcrotonyl-coenzyme A carboxylase alpha1 subunit n=1 Tax=Epidermidibacterium keratini TaxID=1891644 RepID=A0A7L4YNR2_9ACTN|nr:acetyl/propionyl/methylcrotonyl-CoA carboxylase subunit alpha [Epidermidibacterium keratini]QHC00187.1 ATP-grasp domain-containing protein [Epidermidibacterium keratini]
MFDKVLIANRGEIACRIIRTLDELGIESVAVYSDADRDAKHVGMATEAVHLGPTNARESYLNIDKVIAAAKDTGAQAIHPGYGFLAENAAFAQACADAGIVFIGPSASAIETMGDKISAKNTVSAAGVPVVPGKSEPGMTDDDLVAAAQDVGFPVLIKPSAGGGGKGMYVVEDEKSLRSSVESARREAASSFGDDTLFIERYVNDPRHIEVQVLADNHGNTIHLGERECSLQRRHQKIIEEAPSPLLDEQTRARIGQAAVDTAASVDYSGAGTVEFIVSADRPDEFFFMEMNTRLQVEHPVTEMVTGVDLVEQQLRVASGEKLSLTQDDIKLTGHAIEARVYAENPDRDFLPTGGKVLELDEATDWVEGTEFDVAVLTEDGELVERLLTPNAPDGSVRVDTSLLDGLDVATTYDPMISKVIVHGDDRGDALRRLDDVLADYVVFGVVTNVNFLRALINHPAVQSGDLDTGLVGRELDNLVKQPVPLEIMAAFAARQLVPADASALPTADPWTDISGWRASRERPWQRRQVRGPDGSAIVIDFRPEADWGGWEPFGFEMRIGEQAHDVVVESYADGADVDLTVDGADLATTVLMLPSEDSLWIHDPDGTYAFQNVEPEAQLGGAAASGEVRSPMPGTVIAVRTEPGAEVAEGDPLVVVEAMKMEHVLTAPIAGVVGDFEAAVGAQVAVDELLMTVEEA